MFISDNVALHVLQVKKLIIHVCSYLISQMCCTVGQVCIMSLMNEL